MSACRGDFFPIRSVRNKKNRSRRQVFEIAGKCFELISRMHRMASLLELENDYNDMVAARAMNIPVVADSTGH